MKTNLLIPLEAHEPTDSLVNSVRRFGVLKPLIVSKNNGHYFVLDGSARLEAANKLKLEEVPVFIVKAGSEELRHTLRVLLNQGQRDLEPSERARHILELKQFGLSQKEIALQLETSEQEVSFLVRLEAAPRKIKNAVDKGSVSSSAIEPLLALPYSEQENLADAALAKRTVRGIRALVDAHQVSKQPHTLRKAEVSSQCSPEEALVVNLLQEAGNILEQAALLRKTFETYTLEADAHRTINTAKKYLEELSP